MRVGTVRISVEEKEQHRYQLQKHLKALVEAGAERLFYDVASRIADLTDRPGLQELIAFIESGQVTEIVTPDVERLTVNMGLLETLRSMCRDRKIPIIALNMGIDLCSDIGELLSSIAAAGGKYEWSRIQKRTQRNADYEKKHGLMKRPSFGYRLKKGLAEFDTAPFLCLLDGEQVFSKYDLALEQIRFLKEYQTVTSAIAAIHNHFGIYDSPAQSRTSVLSNSLSPEQVDRVMRRRAWQASLFRLSYAGFRAWLTSPLLYSAIVVPDQDKPKDEWERKGLVTFDEWEEIGYLVKGRSPFKRSGAYSAKNLFYRKVICGDCGRSCSVVGGGTKRKNGKTKKVYLSYQCSQWMKERARLRLDPGAQIACHNRSSIHISRVEAALIDELTVKAQELAINILVDDDEIPPTLEMLQLEEDIAKLRSLKMPETNAIAETKSQQLSALRTAQKTKSKSQEIQQSLILEYFSDLDFWRQVSIETKRLLIAQLVEKVVILNGEVVSIVLA